MSRLRLVLLVSCMVLLGLLADRYWPTPDPFVVQANGYEVLDRRTGLVWQRCPVGMVSVWPASQSEGCLGTPEGLTWEGAGRWAQTESRGRPQAWRLPTVHELNTLVDEAQHNPALPTAFPKFFPPSGRSGRSSDLHYFWTANAFASDPASGSAWVIDFVRGDITNVLMKRPAFVRLVRTADGVTVPHP
jgi:hypothetical protein